MSETPARRLGSWDVRLLDGLAIFSSRVAFYKTYSNTLFQA